MPKTRMMTFKKNTNTIPQKLWLNKCHGFHGDRHCTHWYASKTCCFCKEEGAPGNHYVNSICDASQYDEDNNE